jgi:predicted nucleic acid-binding protein
VKVVLDTNVLLAALPHTSDSHVIFLELVRGTYELCLTSDILNEYEEVFQRRANPEVAAFFWKCWKKDKRRGVRYRTIGRAQTSSHSKLNVMKI